MDPSTLIDSLEAFPARLAAMVHDLSDTDWRRRSPTGHWSILEVIAHLADEEVMDFRMRTQMTVETPEVSWPLIDPEQRAIDEQYNALDPAATLARFEAARRESMVWLRDRAPADWRHEHDHLRVGPVPAGELLAAWAAHDWLHLRQIVKRRFEIIQLAAGDHSTKYAGTWTA